MPRAAFAHVRTWVFDLDNTLYPPHMRLFDQIEARMTAFVMEALGVTRAEADRLRAHYWHTYGTTLAGLMREHGVAPDRYLDEVHDIDFGVLSPDPDLHAAIARLPGRRIIYTNGPADYAAKVAEARGLSGLFDAIYGIAEADFLPKPEAAAFDRIFGRDRLDPGQAAMFEDDHRNLRVPGGLGMNTVLVHSRRGADEAHVQHTTDDLRAFLDLLVEDAA